ncbi:hypothetical protein G6O69_17825 [Pseudenhygromyxa sp. WMMC2535]|uniref:hypothetical protein n=1 Tax=Pseudenhygromyxa sp. WMMC2535 TaxID=2712867 RepID=UPI001595EAEA|nr:hypothetical protein [Pseudenhygromyxa sp. WMMC2535]NVB39707.1 hypothetical protein [Pseudenhygromyxa sp. WMMC2535]
MTADECARQSARTRPPPSSRSDAVGPDDYIRLAYVDVEGPPEVDHDRTTT